MVSAFHEDIVFFCKQGHIEKDATNATYCVYNSDVATGYGVGAFLFLLSSESLLMGVTKCMCFGRSLAPGGDRAWSIIYFVSSWWEFWCSGYPFFTGKLHAMHCYLLKHAISLSLLISSFRWIIEIGRGTPTHKPSVLNYGFHFFFMPVHLLARILTFLAGEVTCCWKLHISD